MFSAFGRRNASLDSSRENGLEGVDASMLSTSYWTVSV
jgi:hypothetical protein